MLTRCGTAKADLFIAVTANDHVNMLACVLASELGARRRILRLKDIAPLAGYRYFYKHSLGFDVVLSTEELAADEIVNAVSEQNALEVETFADGMCVTGGGPLSPARVESHGDHRIAKAMGVLALALPGGAQVAGAEAAAVSYPGFWEQLLG